VDNLRKIKRVSSILQYASYLVVGWIIVLVLALSIFLWRIPEEVVPLLRANHPAIRISETNMFFAIPAWIIFLIPSTLMAYGVWRLGCMFRSFRLGNYFSDVSVNHLLVFSLCGFVGQFFAPLLDALAGLVASLSTSEANFDLYLSIDGLEGVQLLAWATFVTVAWILREGIRLAKENEEFV
jgi:hypothetical protein|tara:strand:+ start:279 stop:824 length:546 start_codon:yes stop_codon:yes gene_type:complete